jgi:hypothetical protein
MDAKDSAEPDRKRLSRTLRHATREFASLVGQVPDGVSGVEPIDGGWRLSVEVTELERIPPTTSVMASYELDVDGDGRIQGYRRLRRYYRNQAMEG